MKKQKFRVTGMTCAACQANITRRVAALPGVQDVDVSLLQNQMTVSYDETVSGAEAITAAVEAIGYGAHPAEGGGGKSESGGFRREWEARQKAAEDERRAMKTRLIASAALLIPLMYVSMGHMLHLPLPGFFMGTENSLIGALTQLLITLPILYLNRKFFFSGFKALWHRAPNMDSLVAVGSAASVIYAIFAMYRMAWGLGHGDSALTAAYAHQLYFESAAMILTLVTVGKYLESRSKAKTGDALGRLVDLTPKTAAVVREGAEVVIPAEQVQKGDIVVIRPGERIPADGEIVSGSGTLDQSAVTGESIPVDKGPGDSVISATVNLNGSFRFRASRVGDDTTLAQMIRLVDEAGATKAPIARVADKVAGVFVPVVMGIAALTALAWLIAGAGGEFALSSAVAVLVISCPCALGLATPVAIMVGTGKAAELGILVKSAESLETLHSVDTIVLDKTGTLTSGRPSVTDCVPVAEGYSADRLLAEAASLEAGSEHPLARAVTREAADRGLSLAPAEDFAAHTGRGVRALLDGEEILGGSAAFFTELGLDAAPGAKEAFARAEELSQGGKTPLLFARAGRFTGVVAVADTLREDSAQAVQSFRRLGLKVVMLTGDNPAAAEAIRAKLGIDEAVAQVLPADKEARIRALQSEGRKVAMVGDGINDAPALSRADVGIAIGAGTDIAIDSADVVLMRDSLRDAASAVELSRSVLRNIRENLFWAFFYNVLGIPIAAGVLYPAFGLHLSPMLGAAAMSLSSVCVVLNALRLRGFRPRGIGEKIEIAGAEAASPAEKGTETMEKTLKIEGMMCDHCRAHVQKALEALPGVSGAKVDVAAGTAVVTLAAYVDDAALIAAVTDAGYEAKI